METLRGLVCPTFLAFCGLLDNMPGFLFLRLLSAIKAPKLARPMAVHLQYKAFGYYKLILVKLWKKSVLFLGLVNPFPCHVKYHFFHWRDTVQNWKVWLQCLEHLKYFCDIEKINHSLLPGPHPMRELSAPTTAADSPENKSQNQNQAQSN